MRGAWRDVARVLSNSRASFHSSSIGMVRIKPLHVIPQAPIRPTTATINVPDDHPLYGFFRDKALIGSYEDDVRSWSTPELRRKSFEDLHKMWYQGLKELNILRRELHLLADWTGLNHQEVPRFDAFTMTRIKNRIDVVNKTLVRIRQTLAERQRAYENGKDAFEAKEEARIFADKYLTSAPEKDKLSGQQLVRFAYAIYDLPEDLSDLDKVANEANKIIKISNLKLEKFKSRLPEPNRIAIESIREAFAIYHADHDEAAMIEVTDDILKERKDRTRSAKLKDPQKVLRKLVEERQKALQDSSEYVEAL